MNRLSQRITPCFTRHQLTQRVALGFSKQNMRRAASPSAPVVLMFVCSGMAHAGVILTFVQGIQTELVSPATALAVIGIILAGTMYMFGSGRMGLGAFLVGGAADLATFFFGTS
jgi:type IV secretory pathway VirB2 component (pilin)